MEAIGSILLKPGRLQVATNATSDSQVADDVIGLATRLAYDAAHGGRAVELLSEAMGAELLGFLEDNASGMDAALNRVQAWVTPIGQQVVDVVNNLPDDLDFAAVLESFDGVLAQVINALRAATRSAVRGQVDHLVQALTVDLEINGSTLETLIGRLIDAWTVTLRAEPPDADPRVQRNRLEIATIARRLGRFIGSSLRFPEFSTETITQGIMDLLDRLGLDDVLTQIQCTADALGAIVDAGTSMAELVPFTGMGSGSIGAATGGDDASQTEEYCWYATWLLAPSHDRVWINRERTKLIKGDDRPENVLHQGTNIKWYDAPIFKTPQPIPAATDSSTRYYTFGLVSAQKMEAVAYYSAWIQHLLEATLDFATTKRGDIANSVLNGVHNLALGLWTAIPQNPRQPPFGLHENTFLRFVLMPMIQWLLTFLGSFEGMHTRASAGNAFIYWLTLLGADVVETTLYWDYGRMGRNFTLSLLTLLNQTNPPGNGKKPENYEEVLGVIEPISDLIIFLVLVLPVGRERYAEPFTGWDPNNQPKADNNRDMLLLWFLAAPASGMLGGLVGVLTTQALARNFRWQDLFLESFLGWQYIIRGFLKFWIYTYMHFDGDTDDGKYNAVAGGAEMPGYASESTSPYLLPFEGTKQCAQGNKGIWSHHDFSFQQQIYAYDFAHDQEDEILASRAGTVVDFFDWVPNDTDPSPNSVSAPTGATIGGQTSADSWNFVLIRHDTVDNDHDRDAGGAVITTFAAYGHGRNGGVRQVWADKLGVPLASVTSGMIIGQTVQQGEVIMLAGDTGVSAYNHLHMHVLNGPNLNANQTIPFLFRDGGRCRSLRSYRSDNVRIP